MRSSGWENALENFLADVRYGARQLLRSPGFSLVAILTLAIGIGATAAIFSAVDPILFKALPYSQPDRVVMIWESRADGTRQVPSFGTFHGLAQDQPQSFVATAVVKPWQPAMAGDGEPERLEGQRITPDFFRVLGIAPAMGRNFAPADDLPPSPAARDASVSAAAASHVPAAPSVVRTTRSSPSSAIGVRAAFGASPQKILRLVTAQGMALAAAGVIIGIAGAFAASRLLASLLFGITHLDPLTYTAVTLVLLAVAFAACYIPARRAMQLDPVSALRHE